MSSEPVQLDLLDWLATQAPCPSPAESLLNPPAPDGAPVRLTRVDPSSNMRRFYSVALATSFFGETGVVRHWGRIGTSGQTRTDWYDSPLAAAAELERMTRGKRRRGYQ